MKKGFFITFEGLEGSGKSIQVGYLGSKLRELGYDFIVTREPGGTRIGEQIRAITHNPENVDLVSLTEAYLMAASRAQHVAETVRPAIADGKIVISDRFIDSSIAYQGYGRSLGADNIAKLNALAVDGVLPDMTIFLDVSYELGFARRNGSAKIDRMDLQQSDFYGRVRQGYEELMRHEPHRFHRIDGTKSIEKVKEKVWQTVLAVLPKP